MGDTLISGFDFSNDGHVMWISDNRHATLVSVVG